MIAAYYQMKTKNRQEEEVGCYYSDILTRKPDYQNLSSKCRVCLQEGNSLIFEKKDTEQILKVLQAFGNTTLSKHDEHIKLLCLRCYNFLRQAVIFQKVVLRSVNILMRPVNKESDNSMADGDNSDSFEAEDLKKWNSNTKEMESNTEASNAKEHKLESQLKTKEELYEYNNRVACHICNKIVADTYLKSHLTMHEPNNKKFICEICGRAFRERSSCTTHSLKHTTHFPFKCDFCPYKAQDKCLLKIHTRTHTKDYRYMCTECPAKFLVSSNLSRHMRKHKDPQFKCDTCKRTFYTKALLRQHHESYHTGIKSHECDICGKAFGHRTLLLRHQLGVHKREKMLYRRMPSYLKADNNKMQ